MENIGFIRQITGGKFGIEPCGKNLNDLSAEEFDQIYPLFFDRIFSLASADISGIAGYGEFRNQVHAPYSTFTDFLKDTFNDQYDGYWKDWHRLFATSYLKEDYFYDILDRAVQLSSCCEGRRYLVNNSTFFCNMTLDGDTLFYTDWSRAGIMDFFMDFAIMDLHKPFFRIPEKLYSYTVEKKIDIPCFRERFLCMAYFKGIDTLRYHASIHDLVSCRSIEKSIGELESRMQNLK